VLIILHSLHHRGEHHLCRLDNPIYTGQKELQDTGQQCLLGRFTESELWGYGMRISLAIMLVEANSEQLFSGLYDMLPSSKEYLINTGYTESEAGWALLACFIGGVIGIQVVSRILHRYMPSHVVDCDHTHEEAHHEHSHGHDQQNGKIHSEHNNSHANNAHAAVNGDAIESTPLLPPENGNGNAPLKQVASFKANFTLSKDRRHSEGGRRTSMMEIPNRLMSFVKDSKANCDSAGPCYGYSDPCGQECLKHVVSKPLGSRARTATGTFSHKSHKFPSTVDEHVENDSPLQSPSDPHHQSPLAPYPSRVTRDQSHVALGDVCDSEEDLEAQHHHHVSENEFMSIGLQTSIAIALHKLPEGFITYATNHANPDLGFSVFLALLVHNISEGFAMALPLYLALGSRFRAMLWSSLLGGVSQPLGAGIAALWFKIAGREGHKPGTLVYGCMFAITAGIMTSVALSLFVESLSLNHNRNLCVLFAFIGMALMGVSNALTSE